METPDSLPDDTVGPQGSDLQSVLDAALASSHFRDARRQRELLRYLVITEKNGGGESLNAYSIAFDVFGRDSSFDPATDSSVRVEMHRLRQNLAVWNSDPANDLPYELELPARSYRPIIKPRAGAVAAGAAAMSLRKKVGLALAAVLLVVAGIAGWMFQAKAACVSARPIVTLPEQIAGLDAATSKAMLDRLETFLGYYPLVTALQKDETDCEGTPRYDLRISTSPGGLEVSVRERSSNDAVLNQSLPLAPKAPERDRDIAMAQVAYLLGNVSGTVPLDALRRKWSNDEADGQFRCVMLAHQYFVTNSSPDLLGKARNCLIGVYRKSTMADVPAMLAAIELDAELEPGSTNDPAHSYFDRGIEAADGIDPLNSELLIVRMRRTRTMPNSNPGDLQAIIRQMEQVYPFEPHILNQLAITHCRASGYYEKAYSNIELSKTISIGKILVKFSEIYCNIATGNSIRNKYLISDLETSSSVFFQLIVLEYAHVTNSQNLAQKTVKRLKFLKCNTKTCLTKHLSSMASNPDLANPIQLAINHYFPN